MSLRVLSANCRGLGYGAAATRSQGREILSSAQGFEPDFVFLSETKMKIEDSKFVQTRWGMYMDEKNMLIDTKQDGQRAKGVCLLIKPGLGHTVQATRVSEEGHFCMMIISLRGEIFLLACFYGQSKSDDTSSLPIMRDFKRNMEELRRSHQPQHTILAGDMNCLLFNDESSRGASRKKKPRTEEMLKRILEDHDLVDIWGFCNEEKGHTFHLTQGGGVGRGYSARLDKIFVSEGTLQNPAVSLHPPLKRTGDHLTIVADIVKLERGEKLHAHNDRLLADPRYLELLHDWVREFLILQSSAAEEYITTTTGGVCPENVAEGEIGLLFDTPEDGAGYVTKTIDIHKYVATCQESFIDRSTRFTKYKMDKWCHEMNSSFEETGNQPRRVRTLTEMVEDLTYSCPGPSTFKPYYGKV